MLLESEQYWAKRPKNDKRRDWRNEGRDWIQEYTLSASHPHRQLILNALKQFQPNTLLELGCNAGPNLIRIKEAYPTIHLAGVDINKDAVEEACLNVPKAFLKVGSVSSIPFLDKSYDLVLADAVLMYIDPTKILEVAEEINRVAKKGIIIIDWYDDNELGVEKDGHWARNYPKLFSNFTCKQIELTQETWPSQNWINHGRIFIFHRV